MVTPDHPSKRDRAGLRHYKCSECSAERPDYMILERRGQLFCEKCVANTAEKKAYEQWFVRPWT
jgi:DNA-directed RNA polymerase subunit RPC12/RpoP